MDLRDPALGDTEDAADLGEGEAFVVVQGQDELLPFGQPAHLDLDRPADLDVLVRSGRAVGGLAAQRARLSSGNEGTIERADGGRRDRGQPTAELGVGDAEVEGQFVVARAATLGGFEVVDRRLDFAARLRTDRGTQSRARRPSKIAPRIRGTANVSNFTPRSESKRSTASIRPNTPALTRSPASTLLGRPAPTRPATNLTNGE